MQQAIKPPQLPGLQPQTPDMDPNSLQPGSWRQLPSLPGGLSGGSLQKQGSTQAVKSAKSSCDQVPGSSRGLILWRSSSGAPA